MGAFGASAPSSFGVFGAFGASGAFGAFGAFGGAFGAFGAPVSVTGGTVSVLPPCASGPGLLGAADGTVMFTMGVMGATVSVLLPCASGPVMVTFTPTAGVPMGGTVSVLLPPLLGAGGAVIVRFACTTGVLGDPETVSVFPLGGACGTCVGTVGNDRGVVGTEEVSGVCETTRVKMKRIGGEEGRRSSEQGRRQLAGMEGLTEERETPFEAEDAAVVVPL